MRSKRNKRVMRMNQTTTHASRTKKSTGGAAPAALSASIITCELYLTSKSSAAAVTKSGGNKNSRGRLQRLVRRLTQLGVVA